MAHSKVEKHSNRFTQEDLNEVRFAVNVCVRNLSNEIIDNTEYVIGYLETNFKFLGDEKIEITAECLMKGFKNQMDLVENIKNLFELYSKFRK
jgi:hypothetical protein